MATSTTSTSPPETEAQRLARFQALLTLAHTDAQLVWRRYQALLTANAIVAVVLGAFMTKENPSPTDRAALFLVSAFGLFLAWQWKRLTARGWELEHYWVAEAQKVTWPGAENPFEPYSRWCADTRCQKGTEDWISRHAQQVINAFLIGYLGVAIFAASSLLRHFF